MTIEFNQESDFVLEEKDKYADWITRVVYSENSQIGPISYIFCDDNFLLAINQKYLNHDTLTDIITFDYSEGSSVSGDIFISVERVEENAKDFEVDLKVELKRVMAHGVLHLLGFNDKSEEEKELMRAKEDEKILMFHVEQ